MYVYVLCVNLRLRAFRCIEILWLNVCFFSVMSAFHHSDVGIRDKVKCGQRCWDLSGQALLQILLWYFCLCNCTKYFQIINYNKNTSEDWHTIHCFLVDVKSILTEWEIQGESVSITSKTFFTIAAVLSFVSLLYNNKLFYIKYIYKIKRLNFIENICNMYFSLHTLKNVCTIHLVL